MSSTILHVERVGPVEVTHHARGRMVSRKIGELEVAAAIAADPRKLQAARLLARGRPDGKCPVALGRLHLVLSDEEMLTVVTVRRR